MFTPMLITSENKPGKLISEEKLPAFPKKGRGKRIDYYKDFLHTPALDDCNIIKKIVEQLKDVTIDTEIRDIDGHRILTGEPVRLSLGIVMAMLTAAEYISREKYHKLHTIKINEFDMVRAEITRRLEKFCREAFVSGTDVHKMILRDTEANSFSRMFYMFCQIDLQTFINMYCPTDNEEPINIMDILHSYYPRCDTRPDPLTIEHLLLPASSIANNCLLRDNGNLFLKNDSRSVFDLNINPDVCKLINENLDYEMYIMTELLMRPLCDELVYQHYLDLYCTCPN